jgi:hypothetical protein
MSDTPRSDAEANGKNPFGTLMGDNLRNALVPSDFARQLERELNDANQTNLTLSEDREQLRRQLEEANRRNVTLILERDSARMQADQKWRLREEFEALLGTSNFELGVERVKQLKHALSFVVPKCDWLHHPKKHQHKITEPCPVEELIRKAQNI